MSYTKTNWHDGDTISAAKLNKLENGIENSLSTELQSLYKTLAGKDYAGDPNPTDAEMIDAIAKDAQSGGSGSDSQAVKLTQSSENVYTGNIDQALLSNISNIVGITMSYGEEVDGQFSTLGAFKIFSAGVIIDGVLACGAALAFPREVAWTVVKINVNTGEVTLTLG